MKDNIIFSILFLKGRAGITYDELAKQTKLSSDELTEKIISINKMLKEKSLPIIVKKNNYKI